MAFFFVSVIIMTEKFWRLMITMSCRECQLHAVQWKWIIRLSNFWSLLIFINDKTFWRLMITMSCRECQLRAVQWKWVIYPKKNQLTKAFGFHRTIRSYSRSSIAAWLEAEFVVNTLHRHFQECHRCALLILLDFESNVATCQPKRVDIRWLHHARRGGLPFLSVRRRWKDQKEPG